MSNSSDVPPIELGNEFSQVVVERVRTRNGARLRISVPASGREILLCPLELEALTWASPDLFSQLLASPHGRRTRRAGLMGWLDGKRALVAGAGSGIGRAVARAFAAEGARVAALELDRARCERLAAEQPGCLVHQGDATVLADAAAAVQACVRAFGGLDVLVSCVGIFDFYRGLTALEPEYLDEAFDDIFRVNVKGQIVPVKAALAELRAAAAAWC